MTEQEFRKALARSLDRDLPPELRARILTQVRGKDIVMKKKFSIGFAFVLILVLLAATALALSLHGYLETVAGMQKESGYYEDWSLSEKRQLLDAMQEHGLLSADDAAALTDEAAIDAYIIGRYGTDGRSDTIGLYSILETELGDISTWPQETKVWYSDLLARLGLLGDDEEIYLMPDDASVSPEAAVDAARRAVEDAYALGEHALDGCEASWDLRAYKDVPAHYLIVFTADEVSCSVAVGTDGHVMSSADAPLFLSPAEEREQRERDAYRLDEEVASVIQAYSLEHGLTGSWFHASLEDQFAIYNLIRPIILENMAENPLYSDRQSLYLIDHPYGLPDADALPLDEAIALALRTAAQAANVSQSLFSDDIIRHYIVADSAQPLWKIVVSPTEEGREAGLTQWLVEIDAHTGEVTRTIDRVTYLDTYQHVDGFVY